MDKNFVFRSSVFGGFKKQDVMEYLAQLNSQKANLEQQLSIVSNDAALFSKRIAELESQLSGFKDMSLKLEDTKRQMDSLEKSNTVLSSDNEIYKTRINMLQAEKQKLSSDCDRLKSAESQLGAAMLDARLYSDRLVAHAGEKVNAINKETGDAISVTARKVNALSGNIGELSEIFNKAITELEGKISELVSDMNKAAEDLLSGKLPLQEGLTQPDKTVSAAPEQQVQKAQSAQKPNCDAQSHNPSEKDGSVYLLGSI